jgi:hypothetical protein
MPLPAVFTHLFFFVLKLLFAPHAPPRFPEAARSGPVIFFLCVCFYFARTGFFFTGLYFLSLATRIIFLHVLFTVRPLY